ncbi:MAG: M20/M25/M40 family metallo-hydrolase, partial [bacterium]
MSSSLSAFHFLQQNRETMLEELKSILSYPSISGLDIHLDDCRRCAELIAEMLRRVGMEEVNLHPTAGGQPIVTASWCQAPGKPTVLIYGHYDVQPVDPLDEWFGDPFSASIQNNRLIARGAADDKGQVFMHLKALEAVYGADHRFPLNIKVIIEGQEEIGSRDLRSFLINHKDYLSCDVALVSDTMMWGE